MEGFMVALIIFGIVLAFIYIAVRVVRKSFSDFGPKTRHSLRESFDSGTRIMTREVTITRSAGRGPEGVPADVPLKEASREAIDADITAFGTQLQQLDLEIEGVELTDDTRADYTTALDAYENAKTALHNARADSDATQIAHLLDDGRHAMACVKARALGHPLPAKRPPCFFDPAHGPSVEDVSWAPPGGAERFVPACAVDAARVGSGADPYVRMVGAGSDAMPYWEDSDHAAWAQGHPGPWLGQLGEPTARTKLEHTAMDRINRWMGIPDD